MIFTSISVHSGPLYSWFPKLITSAPGDTWALSDVKSLEVAVSVNHAFKIISSNSAKMFSLVRWHFFLLLAKSPISLHLIRITLLLLEPIFSWITCSSHFLQRLQSGTNRGISQMRAPLEARGEPAGNQNKTTKGVICFWTKNVTYSNPCPTHPHRGILTYH